TPGRQRLYARRPAKRRWRDRRPRSAARSLSQEGLSRVEGVTNRLADEDEERQEQRDHGESRNADPGRRQIGFALQQELAERGGARRHAEPEKVEGGQRAD